MYAAMLTVTLTHAVCWLTDGGFRYRFYRSSVSLFSRVCLASSHLRTVLSPSVGYLVRRAMDQHDIRVSIFCSRQCRNIDERNCLHGRNHLGLWIPRLAARNSCAVLDDTHRRRLSNCQFASDDAWYLLVVPPCVLLPTRATTDCTSDGPDGSWGWNSRHGSSDSVPLIV